MHTVRKCDHKPENILYTSKVNTVYVSFKCKKLSCYTTTMIAWAYDNFCLQWLICLLANDSLKCLHTIIAHKVTSGRMISCMNVSCSATWMHPNYRLTLEKDVLVHRSSTYCCFSIIDLQQCMYVHPYNIIIVYFALVSEER